MNNFDSIKPIKEPPTPTRWQSIRWNISWWIEDHVWYKFPEWIRWPLGDLRRWGHKNITCLFFPRNRWATKVIGREYHDKPEMIRSFLFAAIVDFVEGEKCFETVGFEEDDEKNLREVYNYIKVVRPQLEKDLNESWTPGPFKIVDGQMDQSQDKGSLEAYSKISDAIETMDDKYLVWVTQRRNILWT